MTLPASAEMPGNVRVWSKAVGTDEKIVLERAYVYDEQRPSGIPHYQFSFILERRAQIAERKLLWLWSGWEVGPMSSPLPQPQIQPLDAKTTEHGELLVLFNEYARCWAFRIVSNPNGGWTVSPWVTGLSDRGPAMYFSVGPPMATGSVQQRQSGDIGVDCVDETGVRRRYVMKQKDDKWCWVEMSKGDIAP